MESKAEAVNLSLLNEEALKTLSVINKLPIGVFQLKLSSNGDFSLPYVSKKFISTLNINSTLIDSIKMFENIHLDDLANFKKTIEVSAKKLSKWSVDFRIIDKNGAIKWLNGESFPVKIDDDILWTGFIKDISDKNIKTENGNNEQYRLIGKILEIGVWEIDIETNQYKWDERMYKLFESPFDLSIPPITVLSEKMNRKDFDSLLGLIKNSIQTGNEIDTIIKIKSNSGFEKYLKLNAAIMNNGQNFSAFIYDITEEKQNELKAEELKELAAHANKVKSDFLANISHEIKTPLNGIIGFIDLLKNSDLSENQTEFIETIQKSTNSLMNIINDILDYSKIESGNIELHEEEINVFEFASQIIDVVKYEANKKNLELILNISDRVPLSFYADSLKLKQIIINLLGNAIKFTEQGEVEFEIDAIKINELSSRKIIFKVKDTGIGINDNNKDKIFEAFIQEDTSNSRKFNGTGLGLSISSKLVKLLNSKIELESILGFGSEFKFEIQSNKNIDLAFNWDSLVHIYKVLIIDDNLKSREVIKDLFPSKHFRVDLAKNGIEALEKLNNNYKYDLILVDYNMPYLNGIETIKNIHNKNKSSEKEVPIILMNNSKIDENINIKCKEFGINNILIKPFNKIQLIESLFKIQNVEINKKTISNIDHLINNDNINILIVEDNETNSILLKNILLSFIPNINISIANNGLEAISLFIKAKPDLIFMDIQMPEMNGYRASSEIRKFETDGKIPIIALTAGSIEGEKERCINAGMTDFISKPIVTDTIAKCVNNWFDNINGFYVKKMNLEKLLKNKHFDLDKLLDRIVNDLELVDQLMEMTAKYLKDFMPTLDILVTKNDVAAIKSHIHKLKGTALAVCFNELSNLSIEIEKLEDYNDYKFLNLKSLIKNEIEFLINMVENKNYLQQI